MTLSEIKNAVLSEKTVYVNNRNYTVIKDSKEQWFIRCISNEYMIGLTWADGETLNAKADAFFIK